MFKLFAGMGFIFVISAIMTGLFAGGSGLVVAQTTTAIDEDDTSVGIDDATGFIDPDSATPQVLLYIEKEQIAYANVLGNSFQMLQRGVGGTEVKAHPAGSLVYNKAAGDINALGAFNIARQEGNVGAIEGVIMTPNGLKNAAFALTSFDNPAFDGTSGMIRFVLIATLSLGLVAAMVALFTTLAQSIFR